MALPTGLKITVEPEDKALEMLSQHIKTQGRAFSLFDAARLVLAGAERHRVKVECEAERLVGLFQVPSDGSLFETREEATRHLLKNSAALAELYREEEIELEEPKGVFTSVGVCGMSGEVLGPPSHHSFQTALKRLHTARYSSLPFEEYRRRVRTETSAEFIDKWKDQQRKGIRWVYLKDQPTEEGAEPLSFSSRAEFEAHFRANNAEGSVLETREAIVHATVTREQLSPGLGRLLRRHIEEAKKHLFELSQKIAHGLERRGLKLFKRRSGKMFVSRVKPRAIDPGVVFSERVGAIVNAIKAEPGIEVAKLVETVSPSVVAEAPVEGQITGPTEEQMSVMRDLHWLAEEGYVILYSDNVVFLGVQGEPPQHAPAVKAEAAAATTEAATEVVAEAPVAAEEAEPTVDAAAPEVAVAEAAEPVVEEAAPAAEVVIAEPEAHFVEELPEPAVEAEAPTAELVEPETTAKSDA